MIAFHSHRNIFTVNWKPANQTTRKWNSFAFRNVESLWNSLYIFSKLYQNNNISIHFLIHFCNIHKYLGALMNFSNISLEMMSSWKSKITKGTSKRLGFFMNSKQNMACHYTFYWKSLVTSGTSIWFLFFMNWLNVLLQHFIFSETFPTYRT